MKPSLTRTQSLCLIFALALALVIASPGGTTSAARPQEDEAEECNGGRGGTLFSDNKDVTVEILPGNPGASYTSDLFISVNGRTMNFGSSRDAGKVTRIGRVEAGKELMFYIKVRQTGHTFYTGPGSRNTDGVPHADVECLDDGKINVSFEDLINGGDKSYNDLKFQVTLKPLCGPDPGRPAVTEQITDFPSCGPGSIGPLSPRWGRFGTLQTLESDKGERLELHCVPGKIPSYLLYYYAKPGWGPHIVGMCPFRCGKNTGAFTYSGDTDDNDKPDCFTHTFWKSRDYGHNDDPNPWTKRDETTPVLDHAVTTYDVLNDDVTKLNESYEYRVPPPLPCVPSGNPEGKLLASVASDPPLGPITEAFFKAALARLQLLGPPLGPMTADPFSLSDLNRDGKLDAADRAIFDSAFGTCYGRSPNYNPAADFNADNCITLADEAAFLDIFKAGSPQQNAPPVARCADVTRPVPADSCAVTLVARDLDGGSSDPDGDALTFSLGSLATLGPGAHKATLVVTDARGAKSSCVSNVTVADQTPPAISQPSASPSVLSPPNHKMMDVTVAYTATDNCGAAVNTSLSVTSNEPVDERGSGSTSPDWEVLDARRVRLRAERAGGGTGRVYTITVTATDAAGNTSRRSVEVTVPHDRGAR